MSLIKTVTAAALGYWFGEREGERRAIERRQRFNTVAGRRVWDDTAPGWNARRLTPAAPRWRPIAALAVIILGCAAGLPAIFLLTLYSALGFDPMRIALIVGGAMLAFVGLLRLGFTGSLAVLASVLLFGAHFHV